MELINGIKAVDLAIYADGNLIIGDVHIGFEEALNKQGILVPRQHFQDIIQRMEKILESIKHKIKNIVINGDLKHEFGKISDQEWRHTLKFIDFISRHCDNIILIKGNHDTILGPIAEKRNVKVQDNFFIENKKILITHGDKIPDKEIMKKAETIIIGHEHPAITLSQGGRRETYKCFFLGKYKNKNLIVQPSFNPVTEGADLMKERVLSPFLKQKLDDFDVFIVEDKIYKFGKMKNIKKL